MTNKENKNKQAKLESSKKMMLAEAWRAGSIAHRRLNKCSMQRQIGKTLRKRCS